MQPRLLTILGPTASGKTALAVKIATAFSGEIISADSRQVYRGMDIGSGKDISEYGTVPYHLIDCADPGEEFSLFTFNTFFHQAFDEITSRSSLPILCGGTGLYLDSILRGYRMTEAQPDSELRKELESLTDEALSERLRKSVGKVHNTTDLSDRSRLTRAIEIAEAKGNTTPERSFNKLVIGIRWEREALRKRISERLKIRLSEGMIEEVQTLLKRGVSHEKLEFFGLEYRYVSYYLKEAMNRNDMQQKLFSAICEFAKKQGTWFRKMEKNGVDIRWIDGGGGMFEEASDLVEKFVCQ